MILDRPVTHKRVKSRARYYYKNTIFNRKNKRLALVKKHFALWPTRINDSAVVWFENYYSIYYQAFGSGLHSGWFWKYAGSALKTLELRNK